MHGYSTFWCSFYSSNHHRNHNTFMHGIPHKNNAENQNIPWQLFSLQPSLKLKPLQWSTYKKLPFQVYISPCFRTESQLKAQVGLASSLSSTYLPTIPTQPSNHGPDKELHILNVPWAFAQVSFSSLLPDKLLLLFQDTS